MENVLEGLHQHDALPQVRYDDEVQASAFATCNRIDLSVRPADWEEDNDEGIGLWSAISQRL